tara:strand:- start:741 stop:1388 length:648 start_codon:yes stop_codon:yes gene_type:complete
MAIDNLDHVFREEYNLDQLTEELILENPFDQFELWFQDIIKSGVRQPNSMVLSTSNLAGDVNSRIVLLKDYDLEGFTFYSDYRSKKAQFMSENPKASLLFYSIELERQIRIEGLIEKVPYETSNKYFKSRPKGSQFAAMTSHQSSIVKDRNELELSYKNVEKRLQDQDFDCPEYWGGYCLKPNYFEFWQGRKSRLHDRLIFRLIDENWILKRLSP